MHPLFVWICALLLYTAGRLERPWLPGASLVQLSQAHRVLNRAWGRSRAIPWLNRNIIRALAKACQQPGFMNARAFTPAQVSLELARKAGIVLKAPLLHAGEILEKGVLLLKYSQRMPAFRNQVDMEALLGRYQLVLEPSWSGYASLDVLGFAHFRKHPIVVLSPFRGDREFLDSLGSNLMAIELGPGDWVDPRVFRPIAREPKRYDLVMIARWNTLKRHDLLLRALWRIADPDILVALVAMYSQRDTERKEILMALESSGLRPQIEIFENVPPDQVNLILNQSKVNVLLSRQEGGNRGLFEGFLAGVPGLAFRDHVGIRSEHFQPETGRLIERADLAAQLCFFREHWMEFDPRPWALAHITPEISTHRLNQFLKQIALQRGEPWTRDLVMKCNRPGACYYPEDSAGQGLPAIENLLDEFPLGKASGRGG